jgi:hypothetical protein
MEGKATDVRQVRLPIETVELAHLRTLDDQPVSVECEGVDEIVITGILKTLPGDRVELLRQRKEQAKQADEQPPQDAAVLHERAKIFDDYGPALIEAGTLLRMGEEEVRPAFYFDPAKPRHPNSIPGRLLRLEDKMKLVSTVMRLSGYGGFVEGGDAGEGATFHAGVDRGGAGGLGAVPGGEDVRADAVAGAP